MIDDILHRVGRLSTPGFFIVVTISKAGKNFPEGLDDFIYEKLDRIHQGVKARKFIYREDDWRMILTFFPTNQVVDEKYALKNHIS